MAALLLLAVLATVALAAGHRFVNRWYVIAEIVALVVAVVVSVLTGFVAAGITFAVLVGADTLICSALVLARGTGRRPQRDAQPAGHPRHARACDRGIRQSPRRSRRCRHAASATSERAAPPSEGSALAAQCFVTDAETCMPSTLTVHDTR